MRTLASLTALALLAGTGALAAQQPARVTVTPYGGYLWSSPILRHSVDFTDPSFGRYQETQELSVNAAPRGGVRVELPAPGGFVVLAEGAYGTSDLHYTRSAVTTPPNGPGGTEQLDRTDRATQTTAALQLGRHIATGSGSEVTVSVGGALQHFSMHRTFTVCPPSLPPGGCTDYPDPWADHYSIPSLIGGVALRQAIARRVGLEARGNFSVGRANTEGFFFDYAPAYDAFEAPKHYTVRTAEASIGVVFRP